MTSSLSASASTTHPSRQIHSYTHTQALTHMQKNKNQKPKLPTVSINSLKHCVRQGEKSACAFSVLPEGGVVQGVGAGLQPSSVVSFKVLPPHRKNGHLVEVAELKQELDRRGAAAHHRRVVSDTPILPLGVWTNSTYFNEASLTCDANSTRFYFYIFKVTGYVMKIDAHCI